MADILVIDDDDAFREMLRRTIEGLGHRAREGFANKGKSLRGVPRLARALSKGFKH